MARSANFISLKIVHVNQVHSYDVHTHNTHSALYIGRRDGVVIAMLAHVDLVVEYKRSSILYSTTKYFCNLSKYITIATMFQVL